MARIGYDALHVTVRSPPYLGRWLREKLPSQSSQRAPDPISVVHGSVLSSET